MGWDNFFVILFFVAFFKLGYIYCTQEKIDLKLVTFYVFFESFLILFFVIFLDVIGLNYHYYDEVLVSFLCVFFLPSKYMNLFDHD